MATSAMFCECCQNSFTSRLTHLQQEGTTDPGFSSRSSSHYSAMFTNESCNGIYSCEICNIEVNGITSLRDHVTGAKHKKKLKAMEILTPPEPNHDECCQKPTQLQQEDTTDLCLMMSDHVSPSPGFSSRSSPQFSTLSINELNDSLKSKACNGIYSCEICNIEVSGITCLRDHVTGAKHKKKLKDMKILTPPEPKKPTHLQQEDTTDLSLMTLTSDHVAPSPGFFSRSSSPYSELNDLLKIKSCNGIYSCEICNLKASSIINFYDHVTGAKHKKRLEAMKILAAWETDVETSPFKPEEVDSTRFPFFCEPCGKKFTGEKRYREHLRSPYHDEKIKMLSVYGSSADQLIFGSIVPDIITCDVCQQSFTGSIQFKQHMESIKHAKTVKKINDLLNQLIPTAATPEAPAIIEEEKIQIGNALIPKAATLEAFAVIEEKEKIQIENASISKAATPEAFAIIEEKEKIQIKNEVKEEQQAALTEGLKSFDLAITNVLKLMYGYEVKQDQQAAFIEGIKSLDLATSNVLKLMNEHILPKFS